MVVKVNRIYQVEDKVKPIIYLGLDDGAGVDDLDIVGLMHHHTGCPRKKYLSEISGSQIHVTIRGQPNKQNCMELSNSP